MTTAIPTTPAEVKLPVRPKTACSAGARAFDFALAFGMFEKITGYLNADKLHRICR
jgi:hypothetical protein